MAKWAFHVADNGGKIHNYTITASSKQDAIQKGFDKARKNAKGDLSLHWECRLIRA